MQCHIINASVTLYYVDHTVSQSIINELHTYTMNDANRVDVLHNREKDTSVCSHSTTW